MSLSGRFHWYRNFSLNIENNSKTRESTDKGLSQILVEQFKPEDKRTGAGYFLL